MNISCPCPFHFSRPLGCRGLRDSGVGEVQHRERHRRLHQEGVRQKVQSHLALHRGPKLRLLRHARGILYEKDAGSEKPMVTALGYITRKG